MDFGVSVEINVSLKFMQLVCESVGHNEDAIYLVM